MKHFFTFLLLTTLLASCSSDDSSDNSTPNNIGYCEVIINGQTYRHDFNEGESFSYVGVVDNCTESNYLTMQSVEQFETSSFFLDLSLMHDELLSDFNGYDVNSSNVKSYWEIGDCADNFDFIANYYDETTNANLSFNSSSSNQHTIQDISVYSENNEEIIYAVTGNFNVTYKKIDNSLLPVTGNYRTFIYVIK